MCIRRLRIGQGVEYPEAVLSAQGRRVMPVMRDVIEVLTSLCARLHGCGGARSRAMRL